MMQWLSVLCLAANLPHLPDPIPAQWLSPQQHPRLFCSPQGLASAKRVAVETQWGKAFLSEQQQRCAPLIDKSLAELRKLVPVPGSQIVYGLGMNLDPKLQQRVKWAGWTDPFRVVGKDGTRYPNDDWPDDGNGSLDKATGERYWFIARANGFILAELDHKLVPALADVYALTGSMQHARAAAALLDAVAALYPTNRRGPLDYPTSPKHLDRGGRLQRPYYQAARGLINWGHAIDLVAHSGAFEQPSAYGDFSIREHIIRNMLWDGGTYCLEYALAGYQLHNGHADYMQGAAVVGVLLDTRDFCDVMIEGPLSLRAMLDINIDRNGFYYETSPSYANHARKLYVHLADLLEAMRRLGWKNVSSAYNHPAMKLFLTEPFNRQEVGGHIPQIGDAGPDFSDHSPLRRRRDDKRYYNDVYLDSQIQATWIRLVNGDAGAAQLLVDIYGDKPPTPLANRWSVYNVTPAHIDRLATLKPQPDAFETAGTFYGAKGLALLRGGKGEKRYGAQLFFGPLHNHSQREALTWTFFARGSEWSYDPGYYNKHYRMGFTTQTVSHQAVTINGESHSWTGGTGRLLGWVDTPQVQWAHASHPGAYADAKQFCRLIAQVHNPASGELGYWLDVSIVEGGAQRDDSFHTRMTQVDLDVDLPDEPFAPAMIGDIDYGKLLRADYYLEGYVDKGFYWVAPGAGYGFLGSPRRVTMDKTVRAVLTDPDGKPQPSMMIVDLLGAPGRELFVARSPAFIHIPAKPYLIRRDTGPGTSVFAKVLRFDDDPLASVEGEGGRVTVRWKDGRRDEWDVAGIVQLERFDSEGNRSRRITSGKSLVELTGIVAEVRGDAIRVKIDGNLEAVKPGMLLITDETTTWRIASVDGKWIHFEDAVLSMAQTDLIPRADGWFDLASGISRFFSAGNRVNERYALGKSVYIGDKYVGRIVEIASSGRAVRLEGRGVSQRTARFTARILELGEGDTFNILHSTVE